MRVTVAAMVEGVRDEEEEEKVVAT